MSRSVVKRSRLSSPPIGKDDAVAIDRSELSSISALLEQVTQRITAMGESAEAQRADDVAKELYAAERALEGARRRLTRLADPRRR
jgi:hypothetical protein